MIPVISKGHKAKVTFTYEDLVLVATSFCVDRFQRDLVSNKGKDDISGMIVEFNSWRRQLVLNASKLGRRASTQRKILKSFDTAVTISFLIGHRYAPCGN